MKRFPTIAGSWVAQEGVIVAIENWLCLKKGNDFVQFLYSFVYPVHKRSEFFKKKYFYDIHTKPYIPSDMNGFYASVGRDFVNKHEIKTCWSTTCDIIHVATYFLSLVNIPYFPVNWCWPPEVW